MIRRKAIAVPLLVLALLIVLDAGIFLSGYRLLVSERHVSKILIPAIAQGDEAVAEAEIQCSYFNGQSVQTASAREETVDQCPRIVSPY